MKKFFKIILTALAALCFAFPLAACNDGGIKKDGTVVIAASASPHAEILEQAKPILERDYGIKIQIKIFDDYPLFNPATADGSVYANFFQHTPYLDEFNANAKEKNRLVSAGKIHFEPLGLYLGAKNTAPDSLDQAKDAANLVIAIPNDVTNGARALFLLSANGIINSAAAAERKGLSATKADFDLRGNIIVELSAQQIPQSLPDCDLAVINGNYALAAEVDVSLRLAQEDASSQAADLYANILAVRPDCVDSDITRALNAVLTSDEIREFILDRYDGFVLPV